MLRAISIQVGVVFDCPRSGERYLEALSQNPCREHAVFLTTAMPMLSLHTATEHNTAVIKSAPEVLRTAL